MDSGRDGWARGRTGATAPSAAAGGACTLLSRARQCVALRGGGGGSGCGACAPSCEAVRFRPCGSRVSAGGAWGAFYPKVALQRARASRIVVEEVEEAPLRRRLTTTACEANAKPLLAGGPSLRRVPHPRAQRIEARVLSRVAAATRTTQPSPSNGSSLPQKTASRHTHGPCVTSTCSRADDSHRMSAQKCRLAPRPCEGRASRRAR
eukprot:7378138-Prymnesium_polylepis.1